MESLWILQSANILKTFLQMYCPSDKWWLFLRTLSKSYYEMWESNISLFDEIAVNEIHKPIEYPKLNQAIAPLISVHRYRYSYSIFSIDFTEQDGLEWLVDLLQLNENLVVYWVNASKSLFRVFIRPKNQIEGVLPTIKWPNWMTTTWSGRSLSENNMYFFVKLWAKKVAFVYEMNEEGEITITKYARPTLLFEHTDVNWKAFERKTEEIVNMTLCWTKSNWPVRFHEITGCNLFTKHLDKILTNIPRTQQVSQICLEYKKFDTDYGIIQKIAKKFRHIKFIMLHSSVNRQSNDTNYWELHPTTAFLVSQKLSETQPLKLINAVVRLKTINNASWYDKEWIPIQSHLATYELCFNDYLRSDPNLIEWVKSASKEFETGFGLLIRKNSIKKISCNPCKKIQFLIDESQLEEIELITDEEFKLSPDESDEDLIQNALDNLLSIPAAWPIKLNIRNYEYKIILSVDLLTDILHNRNLIEVKYKNHRFYKYHNEWVYLSDDYMLEYPIPITTSIYGEKIINGPDILEQEFMKSSRIPVDKRFNSYTNFLEDIKLLTQMIHRN